MNDAAADAGTRSPSATAPKPVAGFERLELGEGFLLLAGWVAAPPPYRLRLGDAPPLPLNGVFPRPDLAEEGEAEPLGFVADLPLPPEGLQGLGLSLGNSQGLLLGARLEEVPRAAFQPRGHLDHVSPERLAGWVFNPALWHGDAEAAAVELLIDGEHRLRVPLNCQRPDLPFSAAQAGRLLGFEIGIAELASLMARARLRRDLLGGEHDYLLLTGPAMVGSIRRRRGRVLRRSQGPMAAAEPPPAEALAPPPLPPEPAPVGEPQGYVDFCGPVPALGGWMFGGWLRLGTLPGVETCFAAALFDGHEMEGEAVLARHPRPDVEGLGEGFVAFLPGLPPEDAGAFGKLLLGAGREHWLHLSLGARQPEPIELLGLVRSLAATAPGAGSGQSAFGRLLARPVYEGVETISRLPVPLHLEVDSMLVAPGTGIVLIGWYLDPGRAVKSIRLRCRGRLSAPLSETWIATERHDIREAFAAKYGQLSERPGYVAFVATPEEDLRDAHLEIELRDGTLAFRPLPAAGEGGVAAIRRLLNGLELAPDEVVELCEKVLGPPVVALNRARLAAAPPGVEVLVGDPPAEPRCSIIIPLYGRIDYLMYQCALFSEWGLPADELIYVLDDPPKKAELMNLARSVYRRFGIPLRLLLLPQNLGYAPANNAGLAIARGKYICFLNSDVMPRDGTWLDRLTGHLEADPTLGIAGALLLFEDGTVQHSGIEFARLPQLGNFPFALHPGKGRMRGPSRGLHREEAVTGACMVLRRDLAQQLGGFSEDYVVGDFEDTDLCFRIRDLGYHCAVDDEAVLWHLERQSQGAPGNNWRHNLTLVNAWTFARRWGDRFPDAAPPTGGAVLRLS
ncbi:glycosyltransferase [Siccirubricoccus phaeus]|uniref:glycosyltransferase n=1 Tax=Siccirubricoccus phaeus TaxID=2595053 RepID=UPI0011F2A59C|nr:glycosyltransferase [Siccirubricoccus phaeus]